MEFAVYHKDDENVDPEKRPGQWVLAVGPSMGGRFLMVDPDMREFVWNPMSDWKLLKLSHPELPRPVIPITPQAAGPRIALPGNGLHLN